jgi:hypothetical protein
MVIIVTSVFYYTNFTTFFKQLGLWSTPVRLITALLCAIGSGIFMWKKMGSNSNNLFVSILVGGLKLGSIGFFIGFVGPIIFTPHSNQGPLLGILRTGPYGFFIGLIAGAVYWWYKKEKKDEIE